MRRIDADALIADCNKYLGILNPDRDVKEYARIFWLIGILRNAPTIEPERKKGKWIDDNCSECGFYVHHGDMRNYCPNCGAKMEGCEQDG